jgi:hypothetical protein
MGGRDGREGKGGEGEGGEGDRREGGEGRGGRGGEGGEEGREGFSFATQSTVHLPDTNHFQIEGECSVNQIPGHWNTASKFAT